MGCLHNESVFFLLRQAPVSWQHVISICAVNIYTVNTQFTVYNSYPVYIYLVFVDIVFADALATFGTRFGRKQC